MAATDLDICNLALDNLGVTNKVASLAGTSKEEKACARWYTRMRDLVLRTFPWPFASRYIDLVQSETETSIRWGYVYDVPADFLKARHVFVQGQPRNVNPKIPFEVYLNDAGTAYVIGSDTDGLSLAYTRKFDSNDLVPRMTPGFVDALAWRLAERLVKPLALDADKIKEARQMYLALLAEAISDDINESQGDPPADADYIQARG